jgi:hypothetical protein
MKKNLLVALASLLYYFPGFSQIRHISQITEVSQVKKFQNMIGVWEMIGEQDSGGGLEIVDSTTIVIRFMGEEKKLAAYKIDFSKSPYWFDFSAKDSASTSNFKSLLEFVNDDMLKWQIFVDEERAPHFTSSSGESFYLKRVSSKPSPIIAAAK